MQTYVDTERSKRIHQLIISEGSKEIENELYHISLPRGFFKVEGYGIIRDGVPGAVSFFGINPEVNILDEYRFGNSLCRYIYSYLLCPEIVEEAVPVEGPATEAVLLKVSEPALSADTIREIYHLETPEAETRIESYILIWMKADSKVCYILQALADFVTKEEVLDFAKGVTFKDKSFNQDLYNKLEAEFCAKGINSFCGLCYE